MGWGSNSLERGGWVGHMTQVLPKDRGTPCSACTSWLQQLAAAGLYVTQCRPLWELWFTRVARKFAAATLGRDFTQYFCCWNQEDILPTQHRHLQLKMGWILHPSPPSNSKSQCHSRELQFLKFSVLRDTAVVQWLHCCCSSVCESL